MQHRPPTVLLILDGWGYREEQAHNAIACARTPQWDQWWQTKPHMLLEASGVPVGLPEAQMGNSEVGHMHIGAGRVIQQDFTRINHAIENKTYQHHPVFKKLVSSLKKQQNNLHVMGLLSPGGVHSHEAHLFSFLTFCSQQNFERVYLHLFLDGRDTPPQSALQSLAKLQNVLDKTAHAQIASISGRYYAMDRDKRWDRIESVYQLLTQQAPISHHYETAKQAIQAYYADNISDEFIPPTRIGTPPAIEDGDAVFFFNYRSDRARQLTQAFIDKGFDAFKRKKRPELSSFVTMTSYAENLGTTVVFPPLSLKNTLGEVLSKQGIKQLRIAETEKYAHVTFFLNGGIEQIFPDEARVLIPSPNVATYDMQPEMSAPKVTQAIIKAIHLAHHDVIIANFANADMVGHTGNFAATIEAIEYLDTAMHEIGQALKQKNGQLFITADHGNAESMFDETTQQAQTAHTNLPVPFLYIGQGGSFNAKTGTLSDVAPTLLSSIGIEPPPEMTGKIRLSKAPEQR